MPMVKTRRKKENLVRNVIRCKNRRFTESTASQIHIFIWNVIKSSASLKDLGHDAMTPKRPTLKKPRKEDRFSHPCSLHKPGECVCRYVRAIEIVCEALAHLPMVYLIGIASASINARPSRSQRSPNVSQTIAHRMAQTGLARIIKN